jgi:hypothetical protein
VNNCSLKPPAKSFALREGANQPAPVAGGGLSDAKDSVGASSILGIETVDKMTERQIAAKVRQHFRK